MGVSTFLSAGEGSLVMAYVPLGLAGALGMDQRSYGGAELPQTLRISFPDFWPGTLKFSRTDHLASCLQRSRDLGLPSYTKARAALGLPPVTRWQDINPALSQSDGTVRRGRDPKGRVGEPGHTGLRHRK